MRDIKTLATDCVSRADTSEDALHELRATVFAAAHKRLSPLVRDALDYACREALRTAMSRIRHDTIRSACVQRSESTAGKDDTSGLASLADTGRRLLLDMPLLRSGKKLRNATWRDLDSEASYRETLAQGNAREARFYRLLQNELPPPDSGVEKVVGDVLDEDGAVEIRKKVTEDDDE